MKVFCLLPVGVCRPIDVYVTNHSYVLCALTKNALPKTIFANS